MDEEKGYDFELVLAQDISELKCPICLFLLRQTTELPCSHTSCSSCLQQWEMKSANRSKLTCPVCQTMYRKDQVHHGRQIDRYITTSLQVKCPQHNFFCQWTGTISSYFESHETTCPFKQLQCQNVGCGVTAMRKAMEEHLTECNYRRILCSYCQSEILCKELQAHYDESCKEIPVKCMNEGCQKTFPKRLMASHIMNDCLQPEVACTIHIVGCKDMIKRHELENHSNNDNIHTNLLLQEMLNMKNTLESQILDMQSKLTVLETQNNTFESKIKSLKHEHNQQILEMNSKISVLESENTTLKNSLTDIYKKLESQESCHKESDKHLRDCISAIEQKQEECVRNLNIKHDDKLKELNERINQLEIIAKPQPNTTPLKAPQQQRVDVQILTEVEKEKDWTFEEYLMLLRDKEEDKFIALTTLKLPDVSNVRSIFNNQTFLHLASSYGCINCTKHLIERGVDPLARDSSGNMAIHYASVMGFTDIVKVFLKKNVSMLNDIGYHDMTPLHSAAKYDREGVVKHLMSFPTIDVNIRDEYGRLPDEYRGIIGNIRHMIRQKR